MAHRSVFIAGAATIFNGNTPGKGLHDSKMEGLRKEIPDGRGDRRPKPRLC
jgi:hypothetical protein